MRWSSLVSRVRASPTLQNVGASVAKASARSAWGLFAPSVLSISTFGTYSVFETTLAAVTQFAALGAPQTILREPGRRMPLLGLSIHGALLAVLVILGLWRFLPEGGRGFYSLVAGATIVGLLQLLLNARAKARLAFASVLYSEIAAGGVLLAGAGAVMLRLRGCADACVGYVALAVVEIVAALAGVATLVSARGVRVRREELGVVNAAALMPSVYSVGALVVLDLFIWRRIEVYFLAASPAGMQGVAVFGLATQLAGLFLLLPAAMLESWFPVIARSALGDPRQHAANVAAKLHRYNRTYAALILAALATTPLAILLPFAKYLPWLGYVYGFVMIRLAAGYAGFQASVLYATKRERWLYVPVVSGVIVTLVSNRFLTLRMGLPGALVAYFITQGVVAVATITVYRLANHSVATLSTT